MNNPNNPNQENNNIPRPRTPEEIQQALPQLIKVCQDMVEEFSQEAQEHRVSDDSVDEWKQYIWEAAVDCILGEGFWAWLSQARGIRQ